MSKHWLQGTSLFPAVVLAWIVCFPFVWTAKPVWTSFNFSFLGFCLREEVVSAVSPQRDKFELTDPMKFKAKEFCDLIMLSLYVFIPPARGLEIRTLEVLSGEQAGNFDPKSSAGKNYLLVKDSGGIVLHFNNYKTSKFSGRDELALQVRQFSLCFQYIG